MNLSNKSTRIAAIRVAVLATAAVASAPFFAVAFAASPKNKTLSNSANAANAAHVQVQGQVFVVTRGGTTFKLALVEVSAFRESELQTRFAQAWEAEKEQRNQLVADAQVASDNLSEANASNAIQSAQTEAARREWQRNTLLRDSYSKISAADSALRATLSAVYSAKAVFNTANMKLSALVSPEHFIAVQGVPLTTSKTDADGKFELTLPLGVFAISATGQRMVGGDTESYVWLVRLNTNLPATKLLLTNDNMANTKCAECEVLPSQN